MGRILEQNRKWSQRNSMKPCQADLEDLVSRSTAMNWLRNCDRPNSSWSRSRCIEHESKLLILDERPLL
jgi:hypothetical protein